MPGSLPWHLTYSSLTSFMSKKKKILVNMVFTAFLAQFSLAFISEIVLPKVHNNFLIIPFLVLIFIDPLAGCIMANHILYKHYKLTINTLFLRLLGHYPSLLSSNFSAYFLSYILDSSSSSKLSIMMFPLEVFPESPRISDRTSEDMLP